MKPSELRKQVEEHKNRLMNKARKQGLYENFGQKEVRELKDKIGCWEPSNAELHQIIDNFDSWCMTVSW